jgi:tetratricopeptide (TPR) repeat protein
MRGTAPIAASVWHWRRRPSHCLSCAPMPTCCWHERAQGSNEAIDLYRQGVAAGEKALGKRAFRDDVGHFWGLMAPPYMRARQGLAEALWKYGERDEAVAHYQDMLRLNPNDNAFDIRFCSPCSADYLLMHCL